MRNPTREFLPVGLHEAVRLAGDAEFVDALAELFLEELGWPPAERCRNLGVMLTTCGLRFDPRTCVGFRELCEADARLDELLERGGQ